MHVPPRRWHLVSPKSDDQRMTTTSTDRRADLIALAHCFSDPNVPHDHPDDPALIPSWMKFLAAADAISARYRSDYARSGPLAVIAEPTRTAALLHLVRAWTHVVDAHLDGADHA